MSAEKNHLVVIGRRILEAREKAGLKQKELAERAGISPSRLSKLESGKVGVEYDAMWRIGRVLGISLDILLAEEDGKSFGVKEAQAGYEVNPGLQDLAGDKGIIDTLSITSDELEILRKMSDAIPQKAKKEGIAQLLMTLRTIA